MRTGPNLIVMLTYNDRTVADACAVFEQCKDTRVQYWGFKEEGLPLADMKALCSRMKECGKTTVLEVVAYTEAECIQGAKTAVDCGCDILMGTLFYDSVNEYCKAHGLKYMPFVGEVHERPSVLTGTTEQMVQQAHAYLEKGVYGFDLLGYRYTGDAEELIEAFVSQVDAPVCIAGSINSYERIVAVQNAGAWAFTIGGAFFEHRFGDCIAEQIEQVSQAIETGVR